MKTPVLVVLLIIVILVAVFVIHRSVKGPSGAEDYTQQAQPGGGASGAQAAPPVTAQPKGQL